MSLRRACVFLFLGVAFVYCASPVVTNSDSYLAVPTATSLVHHGDLDLDEYDDVPRITAHYAYVPADGQHLNEFPWVSSLFAVPAVLVADVGHAIGIGPGADQLVRRDEMGGLQLASAALLTAAAVVAITVLAYDRLRGDTRRRLRWAVTIGIVVAFGTTAWSVASRALWQHGPSMLFVAIGLVAAGRLNVREGEPRARLPWAYAVVAGASLAIALTIRPTNALALAAIGAWLVVTHSHVIVPFLAAVGSVLIPWCIVTTLGYGELLQPYGSASRLSLHDEYFNALGANLVSPGRGLFLFSPIALAAVAGVVLAVRRREVDGMLGVSLVVVIAHWLAVSAFGDNWVGGHSYGPRFFTDVIPFLVVLSVPALQALSDLATGRSRTAWVSVAALLAVLSVGVHAQGGVLRAAQCWNLEPVPIELDNDRVWSFSDPALTRGLRRLLSGAPVLEGCDVALPSARIPSQ